MDAGEDDDDREKLDSPGGQGEPQEDEAIIRPGLSRAFVSAFNDDFWRRLQPNLDQLATESGVASHFARLISQLDFAPIMPRIDPQIFVGLNRAIEAAAGTYLTDFAERLGHIARGIYPPNLRAIDGLKLSSIVTVLEDGIPIYFVPRQAIAERLINAADAQSRRRIIGERFDAIIDDCSVVLGQVTHPDLMYEVSAVRQAIAVIKAGYFDAGQALAATVMDSLLWAWGDTNAEDYKVVTRKQRVKKGQAPRSIEDLTIWTHMVMRPVYVAHTEFRPMGGDPIPRAFNRHASLHRISYRQYSKRNCAIAVMLATSLLMYMDRYA